MRYLERMFRSKVLLLAAVLLISISAGTVYAAFCQEACYFCYKKRYETLGDDCGLAGNKCCEWICTHELGGVDVTVVYCQAPGTCSWWNYGPCGQS